MVVVVTPTTNLYKGESVMKWYGSISNVIDGFLSGDVESGRNSALTIFFEDGVLYSYGTHFPMCTRINSKGKSTRDMFWVNGDRWSNTTSKHQAELFHKIPDALRIEIPYSALNSAFPYSRALNAIKDMYVVDSTIDKWIDLGTLDEWGYPNRRHQLGEALVTVNDKYYLSGIDPSGAGDGLYFFTELLSQPRSMEEAYASLKPTEVILAELQGLDVKRQGEWFFIPTDGSINKSLKEIEIPKVTLVHRDHRRIGHHYATRVAYHDDQVFVKGTVRHDERQHRMLKLDNKVWYLAYENVQQNSWGAEGRVD